MLGTYYYYNHSKKEIRNQVNKETLLSLIIYIGSISRFEIDFKSKELRITENQYEIQISIIKYIDLLYVVVEYNRVL